MAVDQFAADLGHPGPADPQPVAIDRAGVDRCFGCGTGNPNGLRLRFERYDDGTVEVRHHTDPDHCGLDSVVHGGIQATVLDEVMGVAAQLALPPEASDLACVTAEMHLRYRRPVPMTDELVARARVERVDTPDFFVVGAIVGSDGEHLTEASSRWRQLRVPN
ncbi:MAG: PaaI family thioesterase [Actinomycetota bacterium]